MPMSRDYPTFKRLRDLGGTVFPVSEEVLRGLVHEHGIGHKARLLGLI